MKIQEAIHSLSHSTFRPIFSDVHVHMYVHTILLMWLTRQVIKVSKQAWVCITHYCCVTSNTLVVGIQVGLYNLDRKTEMVAYQV